MKTILKRLILCFPALLLLGGCTVDVFSSSGGRQTAKDPHMTIAEQPCHKQRFITETPRISDG
jgi:hypothetical protein